MKLFDQSLLKKVGLSEEKLVNKSYKKAIWDFYVAYNFARALTNTPDPQSGMKNRIYARFLVSSGKVNSKLYKKLQTFMRKDMHVISKAFKLIQIAKEEAGFEFGEYYKPSTLGILSADYPED